MHFFSSISKSVAVVKNPPANAGDNGGGTGDRVQSLGREDPLE